MRTTHKFQVLVLAVIALGQAPAQSATITADASQIGPAMSSDQLGTNLFAIVRDSGDTAFLPLMSSAGIGLIRWPGGSTSDYYHWKTNTYGPCVAGHPSNSATAFDTWMQNIAQPLHAHVAITVNYGTNPDCSGRADPNEAAAWVNYANNIKQYGIKYWTVGNEQYFPLAGLLSGYDPDPVDPIAYGNAVATQFYPLMKAQDPTIKIGIDMAIGTNSTFTATNDDWDKTVLAHATYDFVEMHYYPDPQGCCDDSMLLTYWSDQISKSFALARSFLTANGHADMPIFLGEFDRSGGGHVGHETVSIVNALFNGIVAAEATKAGVKMATTWIGIDNCFPDTYSNDTAYGWQHFGSYGLFAAGGTGFQLSCPDQGVSKGTPFPKARAYQVLSRYVLAGENVISATSTNSAIRAYAATNRGGYALLLVNIDGTNTQSPSIEIDNGIASKFNATTLIYGKAEYDKSKNGIWAGPVSSSLGTVGASFSVSLPPWSLTLVTLSVSSPLSVSLIGSPGGAVTSSPSGINCGSTCSANFSPGAQVTLTASPATSWGFFGWNGGGCGDLASTCTVTINGSTSVTATFAPLDGLAAKTSGPPPPPVDTGPGTAQPPPLISPIPQ
jgi:hypothetical protein